jgi:hypothetical protein
MTNTVLFGDKYITYSENFWTGKKKITINGEELQKIDKKTYKYEDNHYTVKGSFLTGVEMTNGVQFITLVRKMTTLETILCFLPFLLVITGGAIGGLCGGAAAAFNATYIRNTEKTIMKIIYAILSVILAFVCYLMLSTVFLMFIFR